MRTGLLKHPLGQVAEYVMMALVLASVVWVAQFFLHHHYLPQPFIFNAFDTFMDWFNTAAFANLPGAYDVWHAVYPPISFVFLNFFSLHSCYGNSISARNCDWIGLSTIIVFYLFNCWLAFHIFRRIDRTTAISRGLAFGLGWPLLYCLERGNLIIVCLPAFMYAYSGLAKSRFWQGLAMAVTINFKPYLVIASFCLAIKREWRALEFAGLLTVAVYLLTLAWFGSGDPFQIMENMGIWIRSTSAQFYEQIYASSSYSSFLLIWNSTFPLLNYVPSKIVERLLWFLPALMHMTQFFALAGLVAAWLQPQAVSMPRIAALLVGVHLASQGLPGYSLTFLIFLVFLEREHRAGQIIALICAYLLSVSYDRILVIIMDGNWPSWLSGVTTEVNFGLAIGQLVRPGLVIAIVWALAFDTITQAILAHRRHRPLLRFMPA
jgi:hypothetical protein